MPTASTKRRNRKKGGAAARPRPEHAREEARPAPAPPPAREIPARVWLVASLAILAVAAFLRLYALELKPMHHDEGVNGFFLTTLLRQGAYKYDPNNYHGPTLYYLSLPLVALFGLSTFAVRLLTVVFGVATVWLVLSLRRHLGAVAALAAAALVAVSPGAVYYSRYFIHETLFVFFTLGIVVAALRLHETGSAWHLMLLALSVALLFATKETAFISVAVLVLAVLVAWGWERLRAGAERPAAFRHRGRHAPETGYRAFMSRLGGGRPGLYLAGAAILFFVVNILFYSSFLTNPDGVSAAVESLKVWTKTGTSDFHKKPVYTYVNWLWQEEAPILLLAAVGSAIALFRRARFAVFIGAWGFGMLAAYSLIPYKTPWLVLSFLVPLAVVAGYAAQELGRLPLERLALFVVGAATWGCAVAWLGDDASLTPAAVRLGVSTPALQAALVSALVAALTALALLLARARERLGVGLWWWAAPAFAVAGLACAVGAYQSWVLNFREYDNDRYPYVYSHSQRELLDLVREVERLAERTGRGKETTVSIASPEYWPLPWYFRDYKAVGYHGTAAASYDAETTPIVIARASDNAAEDQVVKLSPALAGTYQRVGIYALRPGVRLALFARRGLGEEPQDNSQ